MPDTFQAFLAWLLTAAGLSTVTAFVVGAIIRIFNVADDTAKRLIAAVVPFVLVILAVIVQGALNFVPWSIDGFYQGLVVAIELVAGSQAIYQGYKLVKR